jgi:Elongation factor Tu domain 2
MKMTTRARVKCTLIVLSAFVALTATLGSSGAGRAVGCKPAYAPISAKADTDGNLLVSYDGSYVTPIGTFSATATVLGLNLSEGDILLEIRHWRVDASEKVKALFVVRGVGKNGVDLTVIGGSGIQVSKNGTTTIVDVPRGAQEFTIAVDDPEAVKPSEDSTMSTWSGQPPIPEPTGIEVAAATKSSLKMPIDEVRSIPGRGTMVAGTIQQGAIETGDSVVIVAPGTKKRISSVATALQVLGKLVDRAEAGNTVGVLLAKVKREDVARGHLLQAP